MIRAAHSWFGFAAILAICWVYRQRLWTVVATLPRDLRATTVVIMLFTMVFTSMPAALRLARDGSQA